MGVDARSILNAEDYREVVGRKLQYIRKYGQIPNCILMHTTRYPSLKAIEGMTVVRTEWIEPYGFAIGYIVPV